MTTVADLCDVSYALLVEQGDRITFAAMAAGSEEADLGEARAWLDRYLSKPLGVRDSKNREQAELMAALGLEPK